MTVRTRFAPSPSGQLHVGNARTALFCALLAAQASGEFILRIEDTDAERSHSRMEVAILQDLRWLGLSWQEGPDVGGEHGPYRQSERSRIYHTYIDQLTQQGLTYPCFCTPTELALARKVQLAAGRPPRYAGTCAHLSTAEVKARVDKGLKPALRFRVPDVGVTEFTDLVRGPQQFTHSDIGDFVICRADGSPAFFFSNALDDALMGITHVLRGEDHLANTPRQLLILKALSLQAPEYAHLSLLVGSDGKPLSKREGGSTLAELWEMGFSPTAVLNYLARLGHHYESNRVMVFAELAETFDIQKFGKSSAHYDLTQLRHWQKEVISEVKDGLFWDYLCKSTQGEHIQKLVPKDKWQEFIALLKKDLKHSLLPSEAAMYADMLYSDQLEYDDVAMEAMHTGSNEYFSAALALLSKHDQVYKEYIDALGEATGSKGRKLYMPLRAALTGHVHGPELDMIWEILGPERVRQRLEKAAVLVKG